MKLIVASGILLLELIHPVTIQESYLLDVDSVTRLTNNRAAFRYDHRVGKKFFIINADVNCTTRKAWVTREKVSRIIAVNNETKVNLIKKVCYYAGY